MRAKNLHIEMPSFAETIDTRTMALKVLEESSELCEAVKKFIKNEGSRLDVLDAFADVCQTLINFADSIGMSTSEFHQSLERCMDRNFERGRY